MKREYTFAINSEFDDCDLDPSLTNEDVRADRIYHVNSHTSED